MGLDVGKIIDGLKLSYKTLRNLLITSIGAIATVWIIGNKVGTMTTQMETFNASIKDLKTEIILTRTLTQQSLDRIYTDFIEINATNNDLWNSKFSLFIEYGDANKELLIKLLDYEDKRAAAALLQIEKDKEYINSIVPKEKINLPTPKTYNGEIEIIGLDENNQPVDTVKKEYSINSNQIKNPKKKLKEEQNEW